MNDFQTNRNHNLSSWVDHKKTTFIDVLRPDLGAPVSNGEEVLGVAWVSLQCSDWSIVSFIPAILSWGVIQWYQTDLLRIYSAWHFAFLLQPRTTPWSVPIMNFAGIVASYSAQLTDRAALRSPASAMIHSVKESDLIEPWHLGSWLSTSTMNSSLALAKFLVSHHLQKASNYLCASDCCNHCTWQYHQLLQSSALSQSCLLSRLSCRLAQSDLPQIEQLPEYCSNSLKWLIK